MRGLTPGEILRRSARLDTFGRKIALIQGDAQITYAELDERANRIINSLLGLRLQKGGRRVTCFVTLAPSCDEWTGATLMNLRRRPWYWIGRE
jgi:non-ribosomal peptide synthetase component E (peptide arylation enzyme)